MALTLTGPNTVNLRGKTFLQWSEEKAQISGTTERTPKSFAVIDGTTVELLSNAGSNKIVLNDQSDRTWDLKDHSRLRLAPGDILKAQYGLQIASYAVRF